MQENTHEGPADQRNPRDRVMIRSKLATYLHGERFAEAFKDGRSDELRRKMDSLLHIENLESLDDKAFFYALRPLMEEALALMENREIQPTSLLWKLAADIRIKLANAK